MTRRFWIGVAARRCRCSSLAMARHAARRAAAASRPRHGCNWMQLVAGDAGRALGRLAVLRARLGLDREPQPEHVHADRARRRARRTSTASSRPSRRAVPRRLPRRTAARRPYFEAAAVITVLVLLGQVLELRARSRTGSAIRALLGLAPKTARVVRPTAARRTCRSTEVQVGDRLRVRPGEKVPVDGVVVEGAAPSTSRWSPASRSRSRRARAAGHRRHGQRHRQPRDARRARRARDAARADRPHGRRGAAQRARRSSGWPTRRRPTSCRRSSRRRAHVRRLGCCRARSRASRTRSSTRWRC